MLCYGKVWYGMVWYGMVWYCTVWYGKNINFTFCKKNDNSVTLFSNAAIR